MSFFEFELFNKDIRLLFNLTVSPKGICLYVSKGELISNRIESLTVITEIANTIAIDIPDQFQELPARIKITLKDIYMTDAVFNKYFHYTSDISTTYDLFINGKKYEGLHVTGYERYTFVPNIGVILDTLELASSW